jgi:hypothetical protein
MNKYIKLLNRQSRKNNHIGFHSLGKHIKYSLHPQKNYGLHADQASLTLTEFIVNSINIYVLFYQLGLLQKYIS